MQKNNWKLVWNSREEFLDKINHNDTKQMVLELKRINGFDITAGGIPYESIVKQCHDTIKELRLRGGTVYLRSVADLVQISICSFRKAW